ncbi:uncharacterized protein LOC135111957 [Scylla paramamosain]|uniref:uncharacterized protein LOC135111957 n=1 Tax=Scylla paramamosain TaxID=85552 RepID=UPI003083CFAF
MFTFQKFPDTHPGQPVRLILPEGYKLSTVGATKGGDVIFGFINHKDFAASEKETTSPQETLPTPIPPQSPDQTGYPSPSTPRRSPSLVSSPEPTSLHSSPSLPASSPPESISFASSAPSTAIFPLQDIHSPPQSSSPQRTVIFPLPNVDAPSHSPPPVPSQTPISTETSQSTTGHEYRIRLSSLTRETQQSLPTSISVQSPFEDQKEHPSPSIHRRSPSPAFSPPESATFPSSIPLPTSSPLESTSLHSSVSLPAASPPESISFPPSTAIFPLQDAHSPLQSSSPNRTAIFPLPKVDAPSVSQPPEPSQTSTPTETSTQYLYTHRNFSSTYNRPRIQNQMVILSERVTHHQAIIFKKQCLQHSGTTLSPYPACRHAHTVAGQPVRLILPEGYKLSTVGATKGGDVIFGFINHKDFAASEKETTSPQETLPTPIPPQSPDQTGYPSPSTPRRSPSLVSSPEPTSLHSSPSLPASSPPESISFASSAPSTAIFPLQDIHSPPQSSSPKRTVIFPLPNVDAPSHSPPPVPSQTPISTETSQSTTGHEYRIRLSSLTRETQQSLPTSISVQSPFEDQKEHPSPSIHRRSPSPAFSPPESATFPSSIPLPTSSPLESTSLHSSVSLPAASPPESISFPPSTAIFPLQDAHSPLQSSSPNRTAIFPLPKVDAPSVSPLSVPSQTSIPTETSTQSTTGQKYRIRWSSLARDRQHSLPTSISVQSPFKDQKESPSSSIPTHSPSPDFSSPESISFPSSAPSTAKFPLQDGHSLLQSSSFQGTAIFPLPKVDAPSVTQPPVPSQTSTSTETSLQPTTGQEYRTRWSSLAHPSYPANGIPKKPPPSPFTHHRPPTAFLRSRHPAHSPIIGNQRHSLEAATQPIHPS